MRMKVRIISCLLVLLLFCSGTLSASARALDIPYRYGDVDWDGDITTSDARKVLQNCVGKGPASPELADVDWDGKITTTDARLILQAAVGKENYSCIGLWQEWVYQPDGETHLKKPKMSWDDIRAEGVPNPVTGQLP